MVWVAIVLVVSAFAFLVVLKGATLMMTVAKITSVILRTMFVSPANLSLALMIPIVVRDMNVPMVTVHRVQECVQRMKTAVMDGNVRMVFVMNV